jgi:hypothetical protein
MLRKLLILPLTPTGLAKRLLGRITGSKGIKAMLENKHEIPKQPLVAAGIISAVGALAAGAIKLDRYFGSRGISEDSENTPDFVIEHKPEADKTLVLLGGLCMKIDEVAERYSSQLADDTNLIAPIFPETSFNPQVIFERTFRQLEATQPKEILIAGLSMGGYLGWDMLEYGVKTGRQELVEKVSGFSAWGTPFGKNAIRLAPRMLLNTVSRLGYSYTLDRSRSILIKQDYKSLMEAHPAKVVPQCRYLAGNHAGTLPITPDRIVFIRGAVPDPIVNEDAAAKALEHRAGQPIERVVNNESTRAEHAPTDKKSAWFMLNQLGIAKPITVPHLTFGLSQAA